MPEITKGFKALLIRKGKLKHKYEIRVELYSLGFFVYEYEDDVLVNQMPRQYKSSTLRLLDTLMDKYKTKGCNIYPSEDMLRFKYNTKTLLYEPKK